MTPLEAAAAVFTRNPMVSHEDLLPYVIRAFMDALPKRGWRNYSTDYDKGVEDGRESLRREIEEALK